MTHLSENNHKLRIKIDQIRSLPEIANKELSDVVMIVLPSDGIFQSPLSGVGKFLNEVAKKLSKEATLIILGETIDLVAIEQNINSILTYQLWISIKTETQKVFPNMLPKNHFGALVFTGYKSSLRHSKTRLPYTYCPACNLTTRDYGGKKHTYNPYGTLLSDVWRDIPVDLDGDLAGVYDRFADLFGIEPYSTIEISDCRRILWERDLFTVEQSSITENDLPMDFSNALIRGDCVEVLKRIPDNSIDFAFADPPYNLSKGYNGYADDLNIQKYFLWCDEWLGEMCRVLKPGRTLAILNIPLWSVRHFQFLQKKMYFQNWITWDALSYPVRLIMPAHYAILCFTKGEPRQLPGENLQSPFLQHLIEGYCIREKCVDKRRKLGTVDTEQLTDLWSDTHRLKHNTRRVDHPCQLPPKLMYRLISLFTYPGEVVLDPFDGAGTTSLTAHQLNRRFTSGSIGIDLATKGGIN